MLPEFKNGVELNCGKVLEAEKISELTEYIVNKFAECSLSVEEANIIIENIKDEIKEHSVIKRITNSW